MRASTLEACIQIGEAQRLNTDIRRCHSQSAWLLSKHVVKSYPIQPKLALLLNRFSLHCTAVNVEDLLLVIGKMLGP
jgi:hypothetical protein